MSDSELERLSGGPARVLEVRGQRYEVRPITVRQVPAFTRAALPLFAGLGQSLGAGAEEGAGGFAERLAALAVDPERLLALWEPLLATVQIGAQLEREQIEALELDELLALIGAVCEVNADFFVRRLLPAVLSGLQRLTATLGPTPPGDSAASAGGSTTFSA